MARCRARRASRRSVLDDDPTGVDARRDPRAAGAGTRHGSGPRSPDVRQSTRSRIPAPCRRSVRRFIADATRAALEGAPGAAVVLRGDSTCAVIPLEEYLGVRDVVAPAGRPVLLLAPALLSAGRVTVGVHLRPGRAAHGAARDRVRARRGVRVLERAAARVGGGAVGWALPGTCRPGAALDVLRTRGPAAVTDALLALSASGAPAVLAPDAETLEDLEIVADGYRAATADRASVIVRCAPTFAVLAGPLAPARPAALAREGVLVVCACM